MRIQKGIRINGFNLFGKYIEEKGWGKSVVERPDYFFLMIPIYEYYWNMVL